MHPALTAAIAGVFGLLIGSFVNVVVWRVPRHESVVRPGSHCPTCSTPIAWFDNVPVVSWIVRRGRCRHCRGRISIRYPLVEVATGVAFAIVGWRFAGDIVVVPMLVLTGCLVALCAIDIDHLLLPNRVLYPSAAMVVPLFVLAAGVDDAWSSLGRAALGAVVSFAVFYALWFVAPGAMGFGDVRLVTLLGFAAAYFGWSTLVAALVAAPARMANAARATEAARPLRARPIALNRLAKRGTPSEAVN